MLLETSFSAYKDGSCSEQHTESALHTTDGPNTTENMDSMQKRIKTSTNSLSWLQAHPCLSACILFVLISIVITISVTIVSIALSKDADVVCQLTFKSSGTQESGLDSRPRDITVSDLNNDGYVDIVVANSGMDCIGVHLGYGNGTFTSQMTFSTGLKSIPWSVAVADFNDDNQLDVAVANYGLNSIGLHFGYGNGSFANQILFSLNSSRPLSLSVGDFNNDSRQDIVVVNDATFTVIVLLSYDNEYFRVGFNYMIGYDSRPYDVAACDLNNDKRLDIAVVNYGTSNLVILIQNGDETFKNYHYSTGYASHPCSIAIGDLNNDEKYDVVVANSDSSSIGIFLGNGNGTFNNMLKYSTGSDSRPQSIAVHDFDNDMQLDIIVTDSKMNNVLVLKRQSNGTYHIITKHSTGSYSNPSSIIISDFDNDNKTDVVVTDYGTNDILILNTYSHYPIVNQITHIVSELPVTSYFAVHDLNDDNRLDVVISNIDRQSIGIFIGIGNGTFEKQDTYYVTSYAVRMPIALGDFNNDHKLDIVVVLMNISEIGILFGYGNGTFSEKHSHSLQNDVYTESVAVGDLNNDNNLDIVTTHFWGNSLIIYFGYGNGNFTNIHMYSTGTNFYPISATMNDFNNDHILDIIAVNFQTGGLAIILGYGNGSFHNQIGISTDDDLPFHIAIADLNNDTRLDIVYASPNFDRIGLLYGYGNGTFTHITRHSMDHGSYPVFIALGDLNNDNRLDIVIAKEFSNSIDVFLSTDDETFVQRGILYTENDLSPFSLALGDFTSDNQIDILFSNKLSTSLGLFLVVWEADFRSEFRYKTGSSPHPYSIAIGDLNNDNQTDIVVANSGYSNIDIFHYKQGAFIGKATHSTGSLSHPEFVAVADLNKDSLLDIIVINSWNNSIHIFFGLVNGTYSTGTNHSTGLYTSPSSLALADFNKDGWIDIVVSNKGTDNLAVFLGYNYPIFTNQTIDVVGSSSMLAYIAVGDFNNDYQCDIVVSNKQIGDISIFLGYGNGTFREQMSFSTGYKSSPSMIVVGDCNNDGHIDILSVNLHSQNIGIFLNYGNGTFQNQIIYKDNQYAPRSIAIGDFNNDSRLDIVVAYKYQDSIAILLGYGNGSFVEHILYSLQNGSSPEYVEVWDFNNDNILDVAVANYGTDDIGILLGYGNGTFMNPVMHSTGNNSGPVSIAIGDLNKDNFIDIAVANGKNNMLGIFYGHGNGSFSFQIKHFMSSTAVLQSIFVNDLNQDSILDIAIVDQDDIDNNVQIFFGFGNGHFTMPKIYSTGVNSKPVSIGICDFDNDRRVDLAINYMLKDSIGIMLRKETEHFATPMLFSTGTYSEPAGVAVGDFNNDNQLDIVVANSGTHTIGILFGFGDGTFTQPVIHLTGNKSIPSSTAVGDFNRDHHLDIVVVNSGVNNIGIFFGICNGTFTTMTSYSTGINSSPSFIAVSDLNNDSVLDLVVTNWGTNNILLFYGFLNGTFSNPSSYSVGYNARPQAVAIGDINNDNLLDIVVANYGTNDIQFFLQTC